MKLICLIGLIGSGKSTVTKEFIKFGCVHDSFAAPLKNVVSSIFGWPQELLDGDTDESRKFRDTQDTFWGQKLGIENFTPRLALQQVGTDVFRNHFNNNIWVNSLEHRLRSKQENRCIVISDARFVNELKLIKQLNGHIILIQQKNLPEWFDIARRANNGNQNCVNVMKTKYEHVHISEWNWVGKVEPEHIIYNDDDITSLHKKVHEVYKKIFNCPLTQNSN